MTFILSRRLCTAAVAFSSFETPSYHRTSQGALLSRYIRNMPDETAASTESPLSSDRWRSYDPNEMAPASRYRLCISAVVPRPVGVLTSRSSTTGVLNCAPFSYTGILTHDPPIVSHGIVLSRGNKKDSLRNIEDQGEWVFNVLTKSYVEKANACAASFPPEISEVEEADLSTLPSETISVPRLAEAAVSMECKLVDKKEIFNDQGVHTTTIVFGRVVRFHLHESILKEGKDWDVDPLVDLAKIQAVGRAGDITYWPAGFRGNIGEKGAESGGDALPMPRPS